MNKNTIKNTQKNTPLEVFSQNTSPLATKV